MDPHRALVFAGVAVIYTGNPDHKRNPGDFNLTPQAAPRPDKTLCDKAGVFKRSEAQILLEEGLRRGFISDRHVRPFPAKIWAVAPSGWALEARLENAEQGTYHGYPLDTFDRFRKSVLARWSK